MAIRAAGPDPKELEALKQLFSGAGSAKSSGRVYMGRTNALYGRKTTMLSDNALARLGRERVAKWVSEDEAKNDFYNWDDKKRRDFLGQAVLGGLTPVGSGVVEAEKVWQTLVETAARYGAAGKEVSPFDLLTSYVKAAGGREAWKQQGVWEVNTVTGERRYAGPGTYLGDGRAMQADTRVDLTDPDTAKSVATRLFQQMMGRDPGQGELGAFARALNTAEAANPVTQTTITSYDMDTGQQLSQQTESSGGLSAEGKAYIGEQQIKGKKEYGVHQAATNYMGVLEQLVYGSPG